MRFFIFKSNLTVSHALIIDLLQKQSAKTAMIMLNLYLKKCKNTTKKFWDKNSEKA